MCSILPAAAAWRALFFVGILPALLVFWVRRNVEEPPVYVQSRLAMHAHGVQPSWLEIFRPPLLGVTVLGGLMGTGAQGGYYAVTTWLPTFLRTERHLSILDSAGYLAVSIAGAFCGYLTGGLLADRIGRRLTFLVFAIAFQFVAVQRVTRSVNAGSSSRQARLAGGFSLALWAAVIVSGLSIELF